MRFKHEAHEARASGPPDSVGLPGQGEIKNEVGRRAKMSVMKGTVVMMPIIRLVRWIMVY